jgi:hypothetical protein
MQLNGIDLIPQRLVDGARLVRTGMEDSTVLWDAAYAMAHHGATWEEIWPALQEHAALRAAPAADGGRDGEGSTP